MSDPHDMSSCKCGTMFELWEDMSKCENCAAIRAREEAQKQEIEDLLVKFGIKKKRKKKKT